MILRTSRPGGAFSNNEWNVLAQILDFGELVVSDLMRPIHELVALQQSRSLAENMQTVGGSRFSRYPLIASDGTSVLGMVHLKDLFLAQQQGTSIDDLTTHVRPVQLVSPGLSALELFRRFRKGAPHSAIVSIAGQKPVGFLTLYNLLAALVGEIRDEFRAIDNDWIRLDDGSLLGKGSLPIYTLERALGLDIENEGMGKDEADSIGGLLMVKLGDIPVEGQRIAFDRFEVLVQKMTGPRIVMVRVFPGSQPTPDP